MSHFVLRRIGRVRTTDKPAPRQRCFAPVRSFSDERLAEFKQSCLAKGDLQRLQLLESYEQQLAAAGEQIRMQA